MRMRKKSWAEPFLKENSDFVIEKPEVRAGRWHELLGCTRLRVEIGSREGRLFHQNGGDEPGRGLDRH